MSFTNISIIIQARLGSTRLPGKVLKEVLPGRSLLSLMLERICRSKLASQVIVATSDRQADRAIVEEAQQAGCVAFCGSENDVLGRYVSTAKVFKSDVIVRLCADSPLHDAQIVDRCIKHFMDHHQETDFVSNLMPPTFPYGTAVEVFPLDTLLRIDRLTTEPDWRTHVTQYVHRNPILFKTLNVEHNDNLSHLRWAVDYPQDFQFVHEIYNKLYLKNPEFSWLDVVAETIAWQHA